MSEHPAVSVPVEVLRQLLAQAEAGQPAVPSLRLSDLLRLILEDYTVNARRSAPRVASAFGVIMRRIGDCLVSELPERALQYVEARRAERRRPATIRLDLVYLKRACKIAVQKKLLHSSPWLPSIAVGDNRRTGCPGQPELDRLLAALPRHLQDCAVWSSYSSWRLQETLGLQWRNVDRAKGLAVLEPEQSKNGCGRVLPYRANPILDWLINERWERRRRAFVFHENGERITRYRCDWERANRRAGTRILFHDLRRVAITRMVRAGVSQPVAQLVSGHKTASQLARYFVGTTEDVAAALGKVAGVRGEP